MNRTTPNPFTPKLLALALAATLVQGCGTTPPTPKYASPVFQDPNQPHNVVELSETLLDDAEDTAKRLGPVAQPEGTRVPEPPMIQEYSLKDVEKNQIDPLLGQLVRDFELAKLNDPSYQSALYELQGNMINAKLSGLAYTPSLSFANRFLENESSSRTTIQLSQPLFDLERLATLEEKESRIAAAQATMKQREYELAERIFAAISKLILSQEKLTVNQARIKALEGENEGAKREQELGRGTITDVRDAAVRLGQAKAEHIKLESAMKSAISSLGQLTGRKPDSQAYVLKRIKRELTIAPVDYYIDRASRFNSELIVARAGQRMAELAALKSKAAYIPSVSFNAVKSYSDRGDTSNSGVNFGVNVPVNAGTFFQAQAASSRISQAQLSTAQVRRKLEVEVPQLYADVQTGINEVNLRLEAIEAAQLGYTATEKSFKGGVRTRLDVLNSLQTVYTVNEQYVTSVLELAKAYLTLSNLASEPMSQTVGKIQTVLF